MDSAEFDKFADEYLAVHARNIAIAGEQPLVRLPLGDQYHAFATR